MKIKKNIKNKKYKLLKFNLITIKIIKKVHVKKNILINDIEARLKKALKLIYLYHVSNKKIIFIGNPLNINKKIIKLLKKTKHLFVPKSTWISGLITNKKSSLKLKISFKKTIRINNKFYKKLSKLKKIHLVVIIDKKNELTALEESYSRRLPIITLNCDLNPFDSQSSYKIPGNFIRLKDKLKNNFFYLLLLSTLQKAEKIKKQFPFLSHKPGNLRYFRRMVHIRRKTLMNQTGQRSKKNFYYKYKKKPFYNYKKKSYYNYKKKFYYKKTYFYKAPSSRP